MLPEEIENWKSMREDIRSLLSSNNYKKSTKVRVLTKKLARARIVKDCD